ncbi:MAG: SOS response-associated peptidase [Gammaproteobacteria bacterium]|nr:MAG: SOS response-associated peptidase [Gammaproteobacteria bacterium]
MCGRFAFFSPREAVVAAFGADISFQFDPRYNIAPSQNVSLLRLDESGELRVDNYRWGLVPFWAKDPAIGNRMINARAETVAEKPSYRQSFSRRRCLVLASGFYEWHKDEAGKTPFFISRQDDQPFGMAGLWDEWTKGAREGDPLRTCTVITTPANEFMQRMHHRMPVLMSGTSALSWLVPEALTDELLHMLLGPQEVELQAWLVGKSVNNPINDNAHLIERA